MSATAEVIDFTGITGRVLTAAEWHRTSPGRVSALSLRFGNTVLYISVNADGGIEARPFQADEKVGR